MNSLLKRLVLGVGLLSLLASSALAVQSLGSGLELGGGRPGSLGKLVRGECSPATVSTTTPPRCDGSSCSLLDPVCTDPSSAVTVVSGGCGRGDNWCYEFSAKYPKKLFRECHCSSFPSGFCNASDGTYNGGSQSKKTCS